MKTNLSWNEVHARAKRIANEILTHPNGPWEEPIRIYGVPRGGIPVAILVQSELTQRRAGCILLEEPTTADVYVDDIIDTGRTREKYKACSKAPFLALVNKQHSDDRGLGWVVFPWERMSEEGQGPQENVRRLIEFTGDSPDREGLRDTPKRVIQAYSTLFGGYTIDPASVFTVFEEEECDEMILLKDIEFYSHCEHHMMPFFGKAHIAYIPEKKIIGISKLARILEIYARRLQIQERLCRQVTKTLMDHLNPKGAACVLEAQHLCMTARGVGKQGSLMVTSSLMGVFREDARTRSEFLNRIGR